MLGRLARALALHAAEHLVRDLLRQIGAADPHIDGHDAEAVAFLIHLVADLDHEIVALVAHDLGHASHRRVRAAPPNSG